VNEWISDRQQEPHSFLQLETDFAVVSSLRPSPSPSLLSEKEDMQPDSIHEDIQEDPMDTQSLTTSSPDSAKKMCIHSFLCSKTGTSYKELDADTQQYPCIYYDHCHNNDPRLMPLLSHDSSSSSSTSNRSKQTSPNSLASKLSSLRNWMKNTSHHGNRGKKRMTPTDTVPLCIHTSHPRTRSRTSVHVNPVNPSPLSPSPDPLSSHRVMSPSLCKTLFTRVRSVKQSYQPIQTTVPSSTLVDILNTSTLFLSDEHEAFVIHKDGTYSNYGGSSPTEDPCIKHASSRISPPPPPPPPIHRTVGFDPGKENDSCLHHEHSSKDPVDRSSVSYDVVSSNVLAPRSLSRTYGKRSKKQCMMENRRRKPLLTPWMEEDSNSC
jgi:hypothetical protein